MTREKINGDIRLTSQIGIIDKRTGRKHYEVICRPYCEKFFAEEDQITGNNTEQEGEER